MLDIRLVVSRSLLYGALTVGVAVAYVGLVTSVQALLNPDPALLGPALLGAGLASGRQGRVGEAGREVFFGVAHQVNGGGRAGQRRAPRRERQ